MSHGSHLSFLDSHGKAMQRCANKDHDKSLRQKLDDKLAIRFNKFFQKTIDKNLIPSTPGKKITGNLIIVEKKHGKIALSFKKDGSGHASTKDVDLAKHPKLLREAKTILKIMKDVWGSHSHEHKSHHPTKHHGHGSSTKNTHPSHHSTGTSSTPATGDEDEIGEEDDGVTSSAEAVNDTSNPAEASDSESESESDRVASIKTKRKTSKAADKDLRPQREIARLVEEGLDLSAQAAALLKNYSEDQPIAEDAADLIPKIQNLDGRISRSIEASEEPDPKLEDLRNTLADFQGRLEAIISNRADIENNLVPILKNLMSVAEDLGNCPNNNTQRFDNLLGTFDELTTSESYLTSEPAKKMGQQLRQRVYFYAYALHPEKRGQIEGYKNREGEWLFRAAEEADMTNASRAQAIRFAVMHQLRLLSPVFSNDNIDSIKPIFEQLPEKDRKALLLSFAEVANTPIRNGVEIKPTLEEAEKVFFGSEGSFLRSLNSDRGEGIDRWIVNSIAKYTGTQQRLLITDRNSLRKERDALVKKNKAQKIQLKQAKKSKIDATKRAKNLQHRVDRLEKQISTQTQTLQQRQEELEELVRKNNLNASKVHDLTSQVKGEQERRIKAEENVADRDEQLKQVKQTVTDQQKKINQLKKSLARVRKTTRKQKSTITELNKQLKLLKELLLQHQEALNKAIKDLKTQKGKAAKAQLVLQQQIDNLSETNKAQATEIQRLIQSEKGHRERADKLDQQIADLTQQLYTQDFGRREAENALHQLKKEVADERRQVKIAQAALQKELDALKGTNSSLAEQFRISINTILQKDEQIAEMQKLVDMLEIQVTSQNQDQQNLEETLEQLETQKTQAEDTALALQSKIDAFSERFEFLEQELENTKYNLESERGHALDVHLDDQEKIDTLSDENRNLRRDYAELGNDLSDSQYEVSELRESEKALQGKIAEAHRQISYQKTAIMALEKSLKIQKQAHQKAIAELQATIESIRHKASNEAFEAEEAIRDLQDKLEAGNTLFDQQKQLAEQTQHELEETITSLEQTNGKQSEKISKLTQSKKKYKAAAKKLGENLKATLKLNQDLQSQIAQLKQTLGTEQQQAQTAALDQQTQITDLTQQLQIQTKALSEAQENLENVKNELRTVNQEKELAAEQSQQEIDELQTKLNKKDQARTNHVEQLNSKITQLEKGIETGKERANHLSEKLKEAKNKFALKNRQSQQRIQELESQVQKILQDAKSTLEMQKSQADELAHQQEVLLGSLRAELEATQETLRKTKAQLLHERSVALYQVKDVQRKHEKELAAVKETAQQQIAAITGTNEQLTEELTKTKKTLAAATKTNLISQTQIQDLQHNLGYLENGTIPNLQRLLETQKHQTALAQTKIQTLQNEKADLEGQNRELTQTLANLRSEQQKITLQIEQDKQALNGRIQQLSQKAQETDTLLRELRATVSEKTDTAKQLGEQIISLETNLQTQSQQIEKGKLELESIKETLKKAESEKDKALNDITLLSTQLSTVSQQVETESQAKGNALISVKQKEEEAEQLQSTLKTMKTKTIQLDKEIASQKELIESQTSSLRTSEKDKDSLTSQLSSLKTEKASAEQLASQANENLKKRIAELEAEVSAKDVSALQLRSSLDELQKKAQILESQNQHLRSNIQSNIAALAASSSQYTQLLVSHEELEEENSNLEDLISKQEAQLNQAKRDKETQSSWSTQLQSKVSQLTSKIQTLQDQLNQIQQQKQAVDRAIENHQKSASEKDLSIEQLTKSLKEKSDQNIVLSQKVINLELSIQSNEKQLQLLREQLKTSETRLKTAESAQNEAIEQVELFKKHLNTAKEQSQIQQTTYNKKIEELNRRLTAALQESTSLKSSLEATQTDSSSQSKIQVKTIEELQNELRELKEKVTQADSRFNQTIKELGSALVKQTKIVEALANHILSLESTVLSQQLAITASEQTKDKLESTLKSLQMQKDGAEKSLREENQSLKTNSLSISQTSSAKDSTIETLTKERDQHQHNAVKLQQQLEQLQSQLHDTSTELQTIKTKTDELSTQNQILLSDQQTTETTLASQKRQITSLTQEKDDALSQVQTTTTSSTQKQQELANQIVQLKEEHADTLRKELQKITTLTTRLEEQAKLLTEQQKQSQQNDILKHELQQQLQKLQNELVLLKNNQEQLQIQLTAAQLAKNKAKEQYEHLVNENSSTKDQFGDLQKQLEQQRKINTTLQKHIKELQQDGFRLAADNQTLATKHQVYRFGKSMTKEELAQRALQLDPRLYGAQPVTQTAFSKVSHGILAGTLDALAQPKDPEMIALAKAALTEILDGVHDTGQPPHRKTPLDIHEKALYLAIYIANYDHENFKTSELFNRLLAWATEKDVYHLTSTAAQKFETLKLALANLGHVNGPLEHVLALNKTYATVTTGKTGQAMANKSARFEWAKNLLQKNELTQPEEQSTLARENLKTYFKERLEHPLESTDPTLEDYTDITKNLQSRTGSIRPISLREQLLEGPKDFHLNSKHLNTAGHASQIVAWEATKETRKGKIDEIINNAIDERAFKNYALDSASRTLDVRLTPSSALIAEEWLGKLQKHVRESKMTPELRKNLLTQTSGVISEKLQTLSGLRCTESFVPNLAKTIAETGTLPPILEKLLYKQNPNEMLIVAQLLYYYIALNTPPKKGFEDIADHTSWDWLIQDRPPEVAAQLLFKLMYECHRPPQFRANKDQPWAYPMTCQQVEWAHRLYNHLQGKHADPIYADASSGKTVTAEVMIRFLTKHVPGCQRPVFFLSPYAVEVEGMKAVRFEKDQRIESETSRKRTITIDVESQKELHGVVIVDEGHLIHPETSIILKHNSESIVCSPLQITATPVIPKNTYRSFKTETLSTNYRTKLAEVSQNLAVSESSKNQLLTSARAAYMKKIGEEILDNIAACTELMPLGQKYYKTYLENVRIALNKRKDGTELAEILSKLRKSLEDGRTFGMAQRNGQQPISYTSLIKPSAKDTQFSDDDNRTFKNKIDLLDELIETAKTSNPPSYSKLSRKLGKDHALIEKLNGVYYDIETLGRLRDKLANKLLKWSRDLTGPDPDAVKYDEVRRRKTIALQNAFYHPLKTVTSLMGSLDFLADEMLKAKATHMQLIFPGFRFDKQAQLETFVHKLHDTYRERAQSNPISYPIHFVYQDSHSEGSDRGKPWVITFKSPEDPHVRQTLDAWNKERDPSKGTIVMLYDKTNMQGGDFSELSFAGAPRPDKLGHEIEQYIFCNINDGSDSDPSTMLSENDLFQALQRRRGSSAIAPHIYSSMEKDGLIAAAAKNQQELESLWALRTASERIARKLLKASLISKEEWNGTAEGLSSKREIVRKASRELYQTRGSSLSAELRTMLVFMKAQGIKTLKDGASKAKISTLTKDLIESVSYLDEQLEKRRDVEPFSSEVWHAKKDVEQAEHFADWYLTAGAK